MHDILNRNLFLVKEHVGMFKAANNFDIFDPSSGEMILECREDNLGFFTKMLRFSDYKRNTPFNVEIRTPDGQQIVRVSRGISLVQSVVNVFDENDQLIGTFRQKVFSIGGKFSILDPNGQPLCELQGKWHSWDFKFTFEGQELAQVSKKWSGLGKELFTSADNYVLQISDMVQANNPVRQLILAAVICIDMVLKE